MLRYLNELKFTLGEEAQSQNACYINAVQVLAIYMGIYDTDQQGDIPYTEAAQYNFGGPMTPKYDKVQDLYNQWNSELKALYRYSRILPLSRVVMNLNRILPMLATGANGQNLQARFA